MKKNAIWVLYVLVIVSLFFSIVFNKLQAEYSTEKLNDAIDNSEDYKLRLKFYQQEDSIVNLMRQLKNMEANHE